MKKTLRLLLLILATTGFLGTASEAQFSQEHLDSTYVPAGSSAVELTDLQSTITVTSSSTTFLVLYSLKVFNTTTRDVQIVQRLDQDDVVQGSQTISAEPGTHTYQYVQTVSMTTGSHTWEAFYTQNVSSGVTLHTDSYLLIAAVNPASGVTNFTTFNARDFGALCDGTTNGDDTAAIELAIAAADAAVRGAVILPAGTCVLESTLNVTSSQDNIAIIGQGAYQTRLYGNFAAGDIVKVGDTDGYTTNITLRGFQVGSSIQKSNNTAALHLLRVTRSTLEDIIIEGQDMHGEQSNQSFLYDGFWFDGVDYVTLRNFQATADNDALAIEGETGGGAKADLFVSDGKIGGAAIGIHVGGAFGGLIVDAVALSANTIGIKVDQALVAETNREIFFGQGTLVDASLSDGIVIADPGAIYARFSSIWLSSSADDGVWITNTNSTSRISFTDMICQNMGGDCFQIDDVDPELEIVGGTIRANTGAGINATANTSKVRMSGVSFASNAGGDRSGTFSFTALTNGQTNLQAVDATNEGGELVWKGAGAFTSTVVQDRYQDTMRFNDGTDQPLMLDFGTPAKATVIRMLTGGNQVTLSACGTSPSRVGYDAGGKITVGTDGGGVTSCTATFSAAWGNAPACVIAGDNSSVTYKATTSTTVMTITSSADMQSDVISYVCIGY